MNTEKKQLQQTGHNILIVKVSLWISTISILLLVIIMTIGVLCIGNHHELNLFFNLFLSLIGLNFMISTLGALMGLTGMILSSMRLKALLSFFLSGMVMVYMAVIAIGLTAFR